MINRSLIDSIRKDFDRQKVLVILGPRQVGKTTLLEQLSEGENKILALDCDNLDDRIDLENKSKAELKNLIGNYDTVLIDEAQRVKNIGLVLKMIADLHPKAKILATGSSSLELANEINEPATGRLIEYTLLPFSLTELAQHTSEREEQRLLEQRMIYGLYPEVVNYPADAKRTLSSLSNSYLYKDILEFRGVKKPDVLRKLVCALALQVGSEVSYNELSILLGIDKETVENYIALLEKCFVVFRLDSYSKNLRNEIKKGKKIYFYDNGIRNAVISNFAPLELRNDVGALWENLMVSERIKRNAYCQSYAQLYFWRTQQQKEIDLLELQDGQITAFEFKWKTGKEAKLPLAFRTAYPDVKLETITPANYWNFIK